MAEPVNPADALYEPQRRFDPLTGIDVLRHAMLELTTLVRDAPFPGMQISELRDRCNKIITRVGALDAINHAAEDDGTRHCRHCGNVVKVSTTHVWPLRV